MKLVNKVFQLRFARFILVGLSGIVINSLALWVFSIKLGVFYLLASFFAIQIAILNNFIWNSRWTFKDMSPDPTLPSMGMRLIKYNIISWSLDIFNIIFLVIFTEIFSIYILYSNLIALSIVTFTKYMMNLKWVFSPKNSEPLIPPTMSIIIPTYNERHNIGRVIGNLEKELKKTKIKNEIVVVDDFSPDKTYEIVQDCKKKFKNIKLVIRRGEKGLGSAIVSGFRNSNGSIIGVMDADFSHPPRMIPLMIDKLMDSDADIIVGSRFIKGGKSIMSGLRNFMSRTASILVWPMTFTKDPLSGFFILKRNVIDNSKLNSKGFKILLEILVKGNYNKIVEVPYIFRKRKYGKSKLTTGEIIKFSLDIFKLYLWKVASLTRQ